VAKPPRRTRLGGPPARHSRPDSAALLPFASCRSDVARTTGRTRSTAGRTTPRRWSRAPAAVLPAICWNHTGRRSRRSARTAGWEVQRGL